VLVSVNSAIQGELVFGAGGSVIVYLYYPEQRTVEEFLVEIGGRVRPAACVETTVLVHGLVLSFPD